MWTCSECQQQFKRTNQAHSCNDKTLADFLKGKSPVAIDLFWYVAESFQQFGLVTLHPTKTMIGFAANKRMAYLTRFGRDFIDITFPFAEPYHDNLCFHKIAQVPGQQQFNHHFRMYNNDDVNDEVLRFMKLAYTNAL